MNLNKEHIIFLTAHRARDDVAHIEFSVTSEFYTHVFGLNCLMNVMNRNFGSPLSLVHQLRLFENSLP